MRTTKAEWQARLQQAFDDGVVAGKHQENVRLMKEQNYKEREYQLELIKASSSFQEGITKLLMSFRNHL